MKKSYEISAADKKTRKWWLITLLVFSVPNFLIHIFGFAMLALAHMSSNASPKDFYFVYIVSGVAVLLSGLAIYIPYRCAYKSPGTILLTLILIALPLIYGMTLYKFLQSAWEWKHLLALIIVTAVLAWWYFLSFKLRKINKTLRAHRKSR